MPRSKLTLPRHPEKLRCPNWLCLFQTNYSIGSNLAGENVNQGASEVMIVAEYVFAQKEIMRGNIIAISTLCSSLSAVSHLNISWPALNGAIHLTLVKWRNT